MNNIEQVRKEIKKYLDETKIDNESYEIITSPTGNFRLEKVIYKQTKPGCNWEVTKVEIFAVNPGKKIFNFFTNDSAFFHCWLTKNNIEYLICAEALCGGQTVIDLTNQKIESYAPNDDGFIHTDFHLSPDGNKLAVIGCYWACPFVVKLFDFTEPLNLPLPEINEFLLIDSDEIISGWADNEHFKTKGVKRTPEYEFFEDDSFKLKTVAEEHLERIINIDGSAIIHFI